MLIQYQSSWRDEVITYNDMTDAYCKYAQRKGVREATLRKCAQELLYLYGEDLGLSDKFWTDGRGKRFSAVTCRVYEGIEAKEKHTQQLVMNDDGHLKFLIGTVVDLSSGSQIVVDVEMWIADEFLYVRVGSTSTPLVLSIGGDMARLQSAVDHVKSHIMTELAAKKL